MEIVVLILFAVSCFLLGVVYQQMVVITELQILFKDENGKEKNEEKGKEKNGQERLKRAAAIANYLFGDDPPRKNAAGSCADADCRA